MKKIAVAFGVFCIIAWFVDFSQIQLLIVGIVCCIPLVEYYGTKGEDLITRKKYNYQLGQSKSKFDCSVGADRIIQYCKNLPNLTTVKITRCRVEVNMMYDGAKTFHLGSGDLVYTSKYDEMKPFAMWIYSKINDGRFVIVPLEGVVSSGISVTPIAGGGNGYVVSENCESDVYGYEIRLRETKSSGNNERIKI